MNINMWCNKNKKSRNIISLDKFNNANNVIKDKVKETPLFKLNQISKDLGISVSNKDHNNKYLGEGSWFYTNNLEDAIEGSDAILVLTEWEEYSQINWDNASKKMRRPSWVFDSRSIVVAENVKASGLNLWRIGDGS